MMSPRGVSPKKLDLDYVLVCKDAHYESTLDSGPDIKNISLTVTANGLQSTPNEKELLKASLGYRIAHDKIPQWLEPVTIMMEHDFVMYKVKQDMLDKPSTYSKIAKKP